VEAQSILGFMHEKGNGVPQSDEQAYIWYSVSLVTAQSDERGGDKERLDLAAEKLTPEQLIAAQQRAAELQKQIAANAKTP
jgi:hypothetical protein